MKDYNLSDKQEEEFQKLVEEKQQINTISLKKRLTSHLKIIGSSTGLR